MRQIYFDEWVYDEPQIDNNSDEFLSSVIIKYNKNQNSNTFYTYEETSYEDTVFDIYKSKQSKTFETGLSTESDAILKAQTIMDSSQLVQDIVTRTTKFQNYDLEIMDFIICDPRCRISDVEVPAVWEIIGISKDLMNYTIQLTLRYIKTYSTTVTSYSALIDENINYISIDDSYTVMIAE